MQYLQFFGILSWIVCEILQIATVIIKNWSHVSGFRGVFCNSGGKRNFVKVVCWDDRRGQCLFAPSETLC
jgi:hypothetical protein